MIRRLKTLSIVLAAVFATAAVGASVATASEGVFTLGSAPATGIGTGGETTMSAFGQTISCEPGPWDVGEVKETPHLFLKKDPPLVTLTPTWSLCKTSGGLKATFHTNDCDFEVPPDKKVKSEPVEYTAPLTIGCEAAGEAMDIEVFASSTSESLKTCTIRVTPQSGIEGLHLTNGTSGGVKDVTLAGTAKGIHADESGLCGTKETSEAQFQVSVTVRAESEGKATSIEVE
jgi:hypothetical protein